MIAEMRRPLIEARDRRCPCPAPNSGEDRAHRGAAADRPASNRPPTRQPRRPKQSRNSGNRLSALALQHPKRDAKDDEHAQPANEFLRDFAQPVRASLSLPKSASVGGLTFRVGGSLFDTASHAFDQQSHSEHLRGCGRIAATHAGSDNAQPVRPATRLARLPLKNPERANIK